MAGDSSGAPGRSVRFERGCRWGVGRLLGAACFLVPFLSSGTMRKSSPRRSTSTCATLTAHVIPQPILPAGAAGDEAEGRLVEVVVVVPIEGRDVHQAVDRKLDSLAKQAKPLDARDGGVHLEADFVLAETSAA